MDFLPSKIKKHKLAMSFILIIVIFISFGIITIKGLLTLGDLTRTIYEHPLVVSNASLNAALNITKMHRSMKDVVLGNSPDEIEVALKAVEKDEQKVYQQLNTIRENILGTEGQALEKQTRQLFINWKPIRKEVVRLQKSGNKQGAILITKTKGAYHVAKL
ncbi:MAG: MCP four helix bundle domain-containing protein, partial [Desulfobacterales bacterium]